MAELLEKIDRVPGYAIAFLLDESASFWEDDFVDPSMAAAWEHFARYELLQSRKRAMESDDTGGGGGLSTLAGSIGAGGGKNFNTAEVHLQKGEEHYEKKEFPQAIECFKAASNWYFKAGDRKWSDLCRNKARRSRAALTEEEVSESVGSPCQCFCVCEWTRIFTIYAASTKRMATAMQTWERRREEELSFEKGDYIRVIEKAVEEMKDGFSAEQPYTWFRGELNGEVGLFPTTQLMYKPSGKPVLDEDHEHVFRNVTVLDATPLFIRYSAGDVGADKNDPDSGLAADIQEYLKPQLAEVDSERAHTSSGLSTRPNTEAAKSRAQTAKSVNNDNGNTLASTGGVPKKTEKEDYDSDDDQKVQVGSAMRQMDLREFIQFLTDLQIACPNGHIPSSFQITCDQALSAFREANRGDDGDEDTTQMDFEEFLAAMGVIKRLLRIPDTPDQIEQVKPGYWACSYGLRKFHG